MIPVNRPLLTGEDVELIEQTARDGWISGDGPVVRDLEIQLAAAFDVHNAVALSSGTSALDLSIETLAVGHGDVVIAPAMTIISSVAQAARRGAQIQLVDSDPAHWCMQVDHALSMISDAVTLVIAVHLFGLPVDMDPLMDAAGAHGVPVLEDAAEAIGLTYKGRPCGGLGDVGVLSFYANKTVTGGEGGAVLTNDAAIAAKVRSLRNLCFIPEERFVHYELGYNARMPSLPAALVSSQLRRLPSLVAKKREMAGQYRAGLEGHPWLELPLARTQHAENSYWVFAVVLNEDAPLDALGLQDRLRAMGIDTRRFFMPLNMQPVLRNSGVVSGEPMPVAERLWQRGVYLPSGMGTLTEEIDAVIEALWSLL